MTKPQIWIAAFLALFILLFLLARVTKDNGSEKTIEHNPVPQTGMSSESASGEDMVNRLGCVTCHGRDLTGTVMGPNLHNISQYWTRDRLINYLRNPQSFMDNERFQEYKKKYPQTIMPPFNHVDVKELGKVAEYILELK